MEHADEIGAQAAKDALIAKDKERRGKDRRGGRGHRSGYKPPKARRETIRDVEQIPKEVVKPIEQREFEREFEEEIKEEGREEAA